MSNKDTKLKTNILEPSRRNIVKSIAIGGGAIAALPGKWTKPVLNQVILPSHAQTSMAITGDFGTANAIALNFKHKPNGFADAQYALLDLLVTPAHADHNTIAGFCGNNDDNANADGVNGGSKIYIRINPDMTVDLAIDSLISDDSVADVCGTTSTLTGTAIADADVQINGGDEDNEPKIVTLRNMVVSETEVTGDYATMNIDDDNSDCGGSFTAAAGVGFPASVNNSCVGSSPK